MGQTKVSHRAADRKSGSLTDGARADSEERNCRKREEKAGRKRSKSVGDAPPTADADSGRCEGAENWRVGLPKAGL